MKEPINEHTSCVQLQCVSLVHLRSRRNTLRIFLIFTRKDKPSPATGPDLKDRLLLRSFEQLIHTQLVQQVKVGIAISFYVLALRNAPQPVSVACGLFVG